MQAYLQVKVGDKSTETHVLIKRDQQCERDLHTDAGDASAQSQRASFAKKKSLKGAKLRASGRQGVKQAGAQMEERRVKSYCVRCNCYFLHLLRLGREKRGMHIGACV